MFGESARRRAEERRRVERETKRGLRSLEDIKGGAKQ